MASLRQTGNNYTIRFKSRSRTPAEISYSFSKDLFSKRDILQIKKEWEVLHTLGQWDPWSRLKPGEDARPNAVSLQDAVVRYCTYKRTLGQRGQRGGWNANTHQDYRLELSDFARRSGATKVASAISPEDIESYLFDTAVAPATRAKRRRMLKTFFSWLHREGLIEHLPALPHAFVERQTIPEYYTLDEVEAVCESHTIICREDAARKHVPKRGRNSPLSLLWMPDCWRFAFFQGLRRGELLAMRAGAIDLARSQMAVGDATFIPKGKDERVITITPPARVIVEPYLVDKYRGDKVWPGCQPDRLGKRWKRALRRAVRDGAVPNHKEVLDMHDLRDSCCNFWLNEQGVPLERVQELLRHKSIRTTEKFYRSTNVEAQTRAFESAYGERPP